VYRFGPAAALPIEIAARFFETRWFAAPAALGLVLVGALGHTLLARRRSARP
jgi:hypothetical protein